VSITPLELQGVLADKLHVSKLQSVGNVNRQNQALTCVLILAGRTRTQTPKDRSDVAALVRVRPLDHQFLRIQLLDLYRIRWTGVRRHLFNLQDGRVVVTDAYLCGQALGYLP
jgi:hypothetical protein